MFVSFPCRCSGGVLGCYPLLLQLLLRVPQCSGIKPSACWSSPGCFQDHCSATMWNHKAACCQSVAAVAVRAFCLLAYNRLKALLNRDVAHMYIGTTDVVRGCWFLTIFIYIYNYMHYVHCRYGYIICRNSIVVQAWKKMFWGICFGPNIIDALWWRMNPNSDCNYHHNTWVDSCWLWLNGGKPQSPYYIKGGGPKNAGWFLYFMDPKKWWPGVALF